MTLDDALARLDGVRQVTPNAYRALCPVHAERTPSLSIRMIRGEVAAHCFGCGAGTRAVREALGFGPVPVCPPQRAQEPPGATIDGPPVGSPAFWDLVNREALRLAQDCMRRVPLIHRAIGGDLGPYRRRVLALQDAGQRLGPDDPAAWDLLSRAARMTHEFRLYGAELWS